MQFVLQQMEYYTCDKCNGTGFTKIEVIAGDIILRKYCEKCLGAGRVNWTEQVFGKDQSKWVSSPYYLPLTITRK